MTADRDNPVPDETWRHYQGGFYVIVAVATMQKTGEPVVVYRTFDARVPAMWVRALDEFMGTVNSGRGMIADRFSRIS